jgi:hypothetical protein
MHAISCAASAKQLRDVDNSPSLEQAAQDGEIASSLAFLLLTIPRAAAILTHARGVKSYHLGAAADSHHTMLPIMACHG